MGEEIRACLDEILNQQHERRLASEFTRSNHKAVAYTRCEFLNRPDMTYPIDDVIHASAQRRCQDEPQSLL